MDETLSRQIRIYCPQHQTTFEVAESPKIVCEIREHALSTDFPKSEFWEFCCDCQTFSPSRFGTGGKVKDACPHCERQTAQRFVCDECKIVAYDSDEQTKGKIYEIDAAQGIEPVCPGCQKSFGGAKPQQHNCTDIEGALLTSRKECPFCQKSVIAKSSPPPKRSEPVSTAGTMPLNNTQTASTQCLKCGHWGIPGRIHCGNCGVQINALTEGVKPGSIVPKTQLLGSICPNCGAGNQAGSIFCNSCGQALKVAPQVKKNNDTDSPIFPVPLNFTGEKPKQSAAPSANHLSAAFEAGKNAYAEEKKRTNSIAAADLHNADFAEQQTSSYVASQNSTTKMLAFLILGGGVLVLLIGIVAIISNKQNTTASNSSNYDGLTNSANSARRTNSVVISNSLSSNSFSSPVVGRTGRLRINTRIRSASNMKSEDLGTHYQDAKVKILQVDSYQTNEGLSTWYRVQVLENGCDRTEGNGCGNDVVKDGYKYPGEAAMEGWMNAKNIVLE